MKLLTRDDVKALTTCEMAQYVNVLCKNNKIKPYFEIINNKVYINHKLIPYSDNKPYSKDELYSTILGINSEETALKGKIFADNNFSKIVNTLIKNLEEQKNLMYDTEDFQLTDEQNADLDLAFEHIESAIKLCSQSLEDY